MLAPSKVELVLTCNRHLVAPLEGFGPKSAVIPEGTGVDALRRNGAPAGGKLITVIRRQWPEAGSGTREGKATVGG